MGSIFPSTPSFDLARTYMARAVEKFAEHPDNPREGTLSVRLPTQAEESMQPVAGDVLISVGLDWDNGCMEAFFSISRDKGISVITCCYDLIPVLFPQYCVGEVGSKFKEYFTHLSWGSSAVMCISKQSERDYLALCEQIGAPKRRTCVIKLGDQMAETGGMLSDQVADLVSQPFILFVSTIERRKNHEVLYRAYHLLARDGHAQQLPKLVFVGMPGWGVGDLLQDIALDPLTKHLVIQLNHVSDAELNALYGAAKFCVYPSLYEGWGLPVGEALALGKAILASASGSLPEVGGDLVRYIDPWNPRAWADAMLELLKHPEIIKGMETRVANEYRPVTWRDTARTAAALIEDVLRDRPSKIVLWAGYDFSTQAGVHVGASIVAQGTAGFLFFGPYRSLPTGLYRVSVWGSRVTPSAGELNFDVVSKKCIAAHAVSQASVDENTEFSKPLTVLEFSLSKPVTDLEIRCIVSSGLRIAVERVEIHRLDA
jgi:glycosyltransferase involved in cell wall biosynthesis